MNKSNEMERKEQIGNQVQLFLWRLPKENHDAMVRFAKQVNYLFRKQGMQTQEVFQLNDNNNNNGKTSEDMVFTNISNAVSANQYEEEVWPELYSYKDQKHQGEVGATMQSDESAGQLWILLDQAHA
jgi:murein DD-endopeptidase MepM/ murein hydrolase activator NlpD